MQTNIIEAIKHSSQGQEANDILRSCVHCGFCNATCPTYQLLGDELDGPRGRIYMIKQALEGGEVSRKTQIHLDRCLTCLSCETTCPSGVRYSRLVDIGREWVDHRVNRSVMEKTKRWVLRRILPYKQRFALLLGLGRALRPFLPSRLKRLIPVLLLPVYPEKNHSRTLLLLDGCVQPTLAPNINAATARVLDRLGFSLISVPGAGCCGAVSLHLTATEEAKNFMRGNIDAWWPYLEQGAEALVVTASGCGVVVKEYGYHLRNDPLYAEKAQRISSMTRDLSEILAEQDLSVLRRENRQGKIAFHAPCSLQHGLKINSVVESILTRTGFTLTTVADSHLCCGSAGTYSLLQSELSQRLLTNKVKALESEDPDMIATANIGCLHHIAQGSDVPVRHWIELLD